MKQRNANYDLMRSLAIILVIMVHAPIKPFAEHPVLINSLVVLIYTCNSLFFMLSGRLNLAKSFERKEDYILYYKKKTVEILLPYVICSALLTLWSMIQSGEPFSVGGYLNRFYRGLMGENASGHLWFMYSMIGMLLAAPFLAGMVQRLSDWALKLLLALALGWNVVSIFLTADVGVLFAYNNWFLSGWIIHFFAGYALYRLLPEDRESKALYAAAAAGFVLTVAGRCLIPDHFQYSLDLSPLFVLWGMGAWAFLSRHPRKMSPKAARVFRWVARYSFLVYMIHYTVLFDLVWKWIPSVKLATGSFLLHTFLTLVISLAAAFLLDRVLIHPLQCLCRKALGIKPKKE